MTEQFTIGLIGAPFGVEGFVKVKTFSGETEHFHKLGKITLRQDGNEKTYTVEEIRSAGGMTDFFYLKLIGIDSPETAKSLNGAEIIASRAEAAPLKDGEYYVEDLKGLEVVALSLLPSAPQAVSSDENWEVLGKISAIVEGGGGDLAEITLLSGEKKLVPFRKEFLGDIDMKAGRIILLERWILD